MNDYTGHHQASGRPVAGEYVSHPNGEAVIIESVRARQILDSRGFPTLRVTLRLEDGTRVDASAPAGASTGEHEAAELRDGAAAYSGRGVLRAVAAAETEIQALLLGRGWNAIGEVDAALRELDGTGNLSRLGANTVVAVSMAVARAFAHYADQSVHQWISAVTGSSELLPVPHFNVLNGGAHATNDLDFQEFMIAPVGATSEAEAVQTGAEIYHALAAAVKRAYGTTGLGDEGGFAPPIADPEQALDLLVGAITTAGFTARRDAVAIAIDPAANSFYRGQGQYRVNGKDLSREGLADYYGRLLNSYPMRIIEDGFAEDDYVGWKELFDREADRVELVGDDLYVTDAARIQHGADEGYSNAVLIKPNQIGTVSATFDAIATARRNGMRCMVSHRSGETSDTFIADLVVGTGVGQIKSGAPARGERVAKYNRLMDIEADTPALRYGLR
jgi:enolase